MPLIYAVVARAAVVLCEQSTTSGNFASIAQSILEKIDASQDTKLTYVYDRYLFHYLTEGGVIYMCMADDAFGRRIPFAFLDSLKAEFLKMYGHRVDNALSYEMNDYGRTLAAKMEYYSNNPEADRIKQVQTEVDQVRDVMVQNIEKVLERGERIEILVDKTDSLNQAAFQFKKRSTALKRKMWWKNTKLMIILCVVGLLVFYFLVCAGCGFPFWNKCIHG